MVSDVSTDILPRNDGCAISAEYTDDGELDRPMQIPAIQKSLS